MRGKREKQLRYEAKATVGALLLIIAFWLLAGFGAAHLDMEIFHLPLWIVTGCMGTWIFAVFLVYILITKIFVNMELEDDKRNG